MSAGRALFSFFKDSLGNNLRFGSINGNLTKLVDYVNTGCNLGLTPTTDPGCCEEQRWFAEKVPGPDGLDSETNTITVCAGKLNETMNCISSMFKEYFYSYSYPTPTPEVQREFFYQNETYYENTDSYYYNNQSSSQEFYFHDQNGWDIWPLIIGGGAIATGLLAYVMYVHSKTRKPNSREAAVQHEAVPAEAKQAEAKEDIELGQAPRLNSPRR